MNTSCVCHTILFGFFFQFLADATIHFGWSRRVAGDENTVTWKLNANLYLFNFAGTDELSASFTLLIDDDRIRNKLESDDFVAVKVQSDSEAYKQFAQICKHSIRPSVSLFWILVNREYFCCRQIGAVSINFFHREKWHPHRNSHRRCQNGRWIGNENQWHLRKGRRKPDTSGGQRFCKFDWK